MRIVSLFLVMVSALAAHASPKPQGIEAEWTCEHGETQAVVVVKAFDVSADGVYLEQDAVAKIKVIGPHHHTLMSETVPVKYTKFQSGAAHIEAPGIFIGELFQNVNEIHTKHGELVYQGPHFSCR